MGFELETPRRTAGERREVGRLGDQACRVAAREDEQAVDEELAALGGVADSLGHRPQLRGCGVGVGEGDVDFGADDCQWGAQLV